MTEPGPKARSTKGRYIRTTETANRDARAAELRSQGWSYNRIAAELGMHKSSVIDAIHRALADIVREPAEAVLHFELDRLDAELVRLNALEAKVRTVLEGRHITVNNGRVIINPDTGQPMEDDGPILQAVDRLLKIEDARRRNGERRAKLTGLETLKVEAVVHEVTQQDIELREMVTEMRAKNAATLESLRAERDQGA